MHCYGKQATSMSTLEYLNTSSSVQKPYLLLFLQSSCFSSHSAQL